MSQENLVFKLSIDSFNEIPFDKYEKNFTFIVNEKEYPTSRIIADLLSPTIRQFHFTDESINSFIIKTAHQEDSHDFSEFLSLVAKDEQTLTKSQIDFFIEIFTKLGNEKELIKLLPKSEGEATIDNVFSILRDKQSYLSRIHELNQKEAEPANSEDYLRAEVDFISSHFYEIDKENLINLDSTIFENIIKSDKLVLEDENSLLEIVNEKYSRDRRLSYLYAYVNFMLVGQEELERFHSLFEVSDISGSIWNAIIARVLNAQVSEEATRKEKDERRERYVMSNAKLEENRGIPLLLNGEEFNGIIRYLTEQTGGNIHDNGTINVTSSKHYGSYEAKNILNFTYENLFQAHEKENAWVCLDFKNRKIKIMKYSIKSNNNPPNSNNLKSWDIEVSDDGQRWTKIDERRNCQEINGCNLTGTFNVNRNEFSRYVRLRQTEKTWNGNRMWFYYLEFYGYLLE